MDKIFREQIGRNVEVYVDDILIKSTLAVNLITDVKETYSALRQYGLKLNPLKCLFGARGGKFLGYLVTEQGIQANPEKHCDEAIQFQHSFVLVSYTAGKGLSSCMHACSHCSISELIPKIPEFAEMEFSASLLAINPALTFSIHLQQSNFSRGSPEFQIPLSQQNSVTIPAF
ncbi:uncharacterized protein LOC121991201 [Zingiber officinale]|uniref:uncharacterized protein LOC121991201 n=1 Tax=Zingiber officinale TaxID=94328 RepID=UPI001C4D0C48|nr:uncharacterized protein LOC121991201 [Zingiber officinale]